MHWSTLKAVCRREGRHFGSHGSNDFPADIAKPILDSIAITWAEYFGERLSEKLEKWTNELLNKSEKYHIHLAKSVSGAALNSPGNQTSFIDTMTNPEPVLKQILTQTKRDMDKKIQVSQRTLYTSISNQVDANMQTAFKESSLESGSGMKKRIIKILSDQSQQIAAVMFDDIRDELIDKVRELNHWLNIEFQKMIDSVLRYADISERNLFENNTNKTEQNMSSIQTAIAHLGHLIESMVVIKK